MLRKSTMLALTVIAALGLAVNSASAKPGGPGFGPNGPSFNPGILKPIGNKPGKPFIPINPNIPIKPLPKPIKPWPTFNPKPHWVINVHRPRYWYPEPVVVGGPTYIASRPVVQGPCTCLSKEYTPEGAVLFKDRCTNEMAMNPPELPQQQTGAVEQQQQTVQFQQQYVQPRPQGMQQK